MLPPKIEFTLTPTMFFVGGSVIFFWRFPGTFQDSNYFSGMMNQPSDMRPLSQLRSGDTKVVVPIPQGRHVALSCKGTA